MTLQQLTHECKLDFFDNLLKINFFLIKFSLDDGTVFAYQSRNFAAVR